MLWRWIASTVFGKPALVQPGATWTGALIHAIVSVGWASGYAYIAATRPATTRRWIVAGIVYGLIVYSIMQVILLADNNFTYPPTPNDFVNALVAHVDAVTGTHQPAVARYGTAGASTSAVQGAGR